METLIKKEVSIADIKGFMERNYLKNRTTVSKDIAGILDDIEEVTGLPLIRHKFPTGGDYGTWIVPKQWDVKEAWIKNAKGEVIGSYDEHPLFACPYSKAVHLKLSKEELLPHIFSEPRQPDAYGYNWRYASDARLQLKDWGISLPKNIVDNLDEGPFEVLIDTNVEDGEMLIGEIILPGTSGKEIMFLADYCHPGQVNDSFSGLAMFMRVMSTLAQQQNRKYTYRLLMMPETLGSAMYIAQDPERIKNVVGTIFSEMVGWGDEWFVKLTREADTYMDLLAEDCVRKFKGTKTSPHYTIYGNDELMFNAVPVNIPSLSLQKYPYIEYHTSKDDTSHLKDEDLQQAHEMSLYMVDVLEKDAVYQFTSPVPFWMTRFDLFSDDQWEPEEFFFKRDIVYRYLDGKNSLLKIANILEQPFERVLAFVKQMEAEGLVEKTSFFCV